MKGRKCVRRKLSSFEPDDFTKPNHDEGSEVSSADTSNKGFGFPVFRDSFNPRVAPLLQKILLVDKKQ